MKSTRRCILSFLVSPTLTLPNVSSCEVSGQSMPCFEQIPTLRLNNLRHRCKKQVLIIKQRSVSQPKMCVRKLETWYYSPVCFTSRSRASLRRNEQDSPAVEMRQERILQLFSSSYKGNLLLLFCFSCLCFPPTLTQKLNSHTGKEKKKKKTSRGLLGTQLVICSSRRQ